MIPKEEDDLSPRPTSFSRVGIVTSELPDDEHPVNKHRQTMRPKKENMLKDINLVLPTKSRHINYSITVHIALD